MKELLAIITMFVSVANADIAQVDINDIAKRVVEIRMTRNVEPVTAESKHKKKIEIMPLSSAICSGAFINSEGDIITAKHCVNGFDTFEVLTYDNKVYIGQPIATSNYKDLAMIHIDRRNTPHFDPAPLVEVGMVVYVLGSPLGLTNTLSKGVIAKLDGDYTLLDCSVLPGNSGGPVFNNDGKLVGVVTAGFVVFGSMTHLNISQSVESVWFFVRDVISHLNR